MMPRIPERGDPNRPAGAERHDSNGAQRGTPGSAARGARIDAPGGRHGALALQLGGCQQGRQAPAEGTVDLEGSRSQELATGGVGLNVCDRNIERVQEMAYIILAEREGEFRHGLGNRLAFLQASGNGKAEFHELL